MLAIVLKSSSPSDITNNSVNIFVAIQAPVQMVRVMRECRSFRLFTQLTLSICTVLEKLLSYSQDSLYFLLLNMLRVYMCQWGIL